MGVLVFSHRDPQSANPPVSSAAYISALVRDAIIAIELCRGNAEQIAIAAEAVEQPFACAPDQLLELLADAWQRLTRLAEVTDVPGPSFCFPSRELAEAALAQQRKAPDIIYALREHEAGDFSVGVYRLH